MAKRKTKAQREKEQKSALRQRVRDVMAGACEGDIPEDDTWVTLGQINNVISGLIEALDIPRTNEGLDRGWLQGIPYWMFAPNYLHNFEDVDSVTEHLWNHGVRA